MDSYFFKYGVVIVGVVIVVSLMSFAYNSLSGTLKVPEDKQQDIKGTADDLVYRLDKLCEICLGRSVNRDCFILGVDLTDEPVAQDRFTGDIIIDEPVNVGQSYVKVIYDEGKCIVRKMS